MGSVQLAIDRARELADDREKPYLWPDDDLVAWAAEAEEQACRRARLIHDDRSIALDTPSSPTLAATTGTLNDATYSYRLSAVNKSGETLASVAVTLAVTGGVGSNGVILTWTEIDGATGYKIYGRTGGAEKWLTDIEEGILTWTDDGSVNESAITPPEENTTEDVVKISILAGKRYYPVHDCINEIVKAYVSDGTTDTVLIPLDGRKELDDKNVDWRNEADTPNYYIFDENEIMVAYTPSADTTLWLEVKRNQINPISKITDDFEIHRSHHIHLTDWLLYKMYSKKDADTEDKNLAKEHEGRFRKYFGPRPTAKRRKPQEANRPHHVKSHW